MIKLWGVYYLSDLMVSLVCKKSPKKCAYDNKFIYVMM